MLATDAVLDAEIQNTLRSEILDVLATLYGLTGRGDVQGRRLVKALAAHLIARHLEPECADDVAGDF